MKANRSARDRPTAAGLRPPSPLLRLLAVSVLAGGALAVAISLAASAGTKILLSAGNGSGSAASPVAAAGRPAGG